MPVFASIPCLLGSQASETDVDQRNTPPSGLPRVLGLWMAIAVVIGNTIGAGIFVKPGRIAADAGSFPLIFSVWIFGTVLCVLGGLCLAELSAMLPRSGGLYVYLREAYGPLPAFLFGWQEFLFARPASTAALAVVCVSSLFRILGGAIGPWQVVPFSMCLILAVAWFNVLGVMWGARLQALTTIVKCGLVLTIALLPWIVSLLGGSPLGFGLLTQTVDPQQSTMSGQFAAVLLAVMWAFNGWEGVVPIAEEVKNPGRNLPLALLGGIGLLGVLYMGATLAYHMVIPISEMVIAENREHVAELLLTRSLGAWAGSMMSVGLVLSTLGTINSNLLTSPRVTYAMGRDGLLPSVFGSLHPRYQTPMAAILFQAAIACVMVIGSALLIEFTDYFHKRTIFDLLTDCIVFAASLFYTAAIASLIVLRYKQPGLARPFRTPGYPWTPLLYIVAYGWFILSILREQPVEGLFGILLILIGIPYFMHRTRSR
ncbi:MAG: Serine/threonine exchanger SteT [Planctomycetota bacterium]